jgi:hypothetical protein
MMMVMEVVVLVIMVIKVCSVSVCATVIGNVHTHFIFDFGGSLKADILTAVFTFLFFN